MTRLTENIVHGGQTQLHKFRMLAQVFVTTLSLSVAGGTLYFIFKLYTQGTWHGSWGTTWFELKVTASYYLAEALQATGLRTVPFPGNSPGAGGLQYKPIPWVLSHPAILEIANETSAALKAHGLEATLVTIALFVIISCFWIYQGKKAKRSQILSGASVVTPKVLQSLLTREHWSKSTAPSETPLLRIAGIPLVNGCETQHIMFVGTTGTGKSNAINELLLQIRELGHKAVIVDTTSLIVPKFLQIRDHLLNPLNASLITRDHLLNPLDARARPWNLWVETNGNTDIEALAETMIPQTSHDPFWSNAARTIFVECIKKLQGQGERSTKALLDLCLRSPTWELHQALENTVAASMVDPSAERMTMSIRSILSTHIKCLEDVGDTAGPFSIRRWMQNEGDSGPVPRSSESVGGSWLFLSCLPGQRASMRSLLSGWLSIAMRALMDQEPSQKRKVWFIIDELPSLNVINDLPRALSELRKYGGCCVLGVQDLSQLDKLYGHDLTRSIAGLTGTKVIFRAADEYNAERFSRFLGQQEVMESRTSITFGAHQVRDGVSLAEHKQMKPVVSPNDIMSLNNLDAFLSLPGNVPVARVQFPYHELPGNAEGFVAKAVNVASPS